MKSNKVKLTAEDILQFYSEKPSFDLSQTDASILYGWASTRNGLYSISDFYRYFEEKGFTKSDVDEVLYKSFQRCDYNSKLSKLEKGKTHYLKSISVFNYLPDYRKGSRYLSSLYYFIDITNEVAEELKKEYEQDSKNHVQRLIERRTNRQPEKSATQKAKAEKLKPKKIKKTPVVEIELK